MRHELKSHPVNFKRLVDGQPFDVRKNDRDYQVGDEIVFKEYDPNMNMGKPRGYTGKEIVKKVDSISPMDKVPTMLEELKTYTLKSENWPYGYLGNYAILGLSPVQMPDVKFKTAHPMVYKMAKSMDLQLVAHASKGRPEDFNLSPEQTMDRLWENVHELGRAITDLNNPRKPGIGTDTVLVKAADVANYAMFSAKVAGCFK